jgi:hypothetical protein
VSHKSSWLSGVIVEINFSFLNHRTQSLCSKDYRAESSQSYLILIEWKIFTYEDCQALRHALLCVPMVLVERIILLVNGKQQMKSSKRYADMMEAIREYRRSLVGPIKWIVRCRLDRLLL